MVYTNKLQSFPLGIPCYSNPIQLRDWKPLSSLFDEGPVRPEALDAEIASQPFVVHCACASFFGGAPVGVKDECQRQYRGAVWESLGY